jgi:hypothetical protein
MILEAAHLVYYEFWGKDLENILQNCGNFKYLAEEQIDSLKLDKLLYNGVVLLARKEYEVAYHDLCSYKKNRDTPNTGGVIVTGQSGIGMHLSPSAVSFANNCHPTGKTCFIYYLLFRLLCDKQLVAFQVEDVFVFFQDRGVRLSYGEMSPPQLPDGTWALSDSRIRFKQPCSAFMTRGVWVVQTTYPSPDRWKAMQKEQCAFRYWMDVFSLDEMLALGYV